MPMRTSEGKLCSSCGKFFPHDEVESNFRKNRFNRDGLQNACKSCKKIPYHQNKEIEIARVKNWQRVNAQHLFEYRNHHRERDKARYRERYLANRESIRRKNKTSRVSVVYTITEEDWFKILDDINCQCYFCGVEFDNFCHPEMDRIIPGKFGGGYTAVNVIPACKSCNSSRGSKSVEEFCSWRKSLGLVVVDRKVEDA